MNVLSLFDGMACGRIALERCGYNVTNYFASEIDKYAMKVAKANYPDIQHLGDVRSVITDDLPEIDLLIGGSPCQGFSFAGRHLNFEDQRSRLFFEYVRILEETQPRYFLLENVRMSKESERVISEFLDCEPVTINSNLVSAQNRHRLYWTNIPVDGLPDDKGIKLADIIESGNVDRDKAHCIDANYWKGGNLKSYFEKNRRQLVFGQSVDDYRKLSPIECERLQTVPDNYTAHVSNTQRYKMLGNGWTVDVISHILKNMEIDDV
jgi:site-specific DNA-cytosine methylase